MSMQPVLWVILAGYVIAALMCMRAILKGPTSVDRIVAADVFLSATVVLVVADMAVNRHTETLAVAAMLCLFAMVGTVSVAKFMRGQES